MKKTLFILLSTILIVSNSCQKKVDMAKEKEAVLKVLQEEGDAYAVNDLERVYSLHIQDETSTRFDGVTIYKGWDQIKDLYKSFVEGNKGNTDYKNPKNIKENVIIKVTGNNAWIICDNVWKYEYQGKPGEMTNTQIAFFEKVNGKWKFSFQAFVTKPEPKSESSAAGIN
jgi:ketosteroid isomerase-like protein